MHGFVLNERADATDNASCAQTRLFGIQAVYFLHELLLDSLAGSFAKFLS